MKKKHRHIWCKWWKVRSTNHWESLCADCGEIRTTKIKPPIRRRNF